MSPLILTLQIDKGSFAFFNALRERHFPVERNFLAAHITLFHALPYDVLDGVSTYLRELALQTCRFDVRVRGLRFLGRGVAYSLSSEKLSQLHAVMQQQWWDGLTPQDRQKLNPHITIQNKANPATAKELYSTLNSQPLPATISATGFELWEYRGGPWQHLEAFDFTE